MRNALVIAALCMVIGCAGDPGSVERPHGGDATPPEGFPGHVSFATEGTRVDGVLKRLKGMNLVDPIAQATWGQPGEVGPFEKAYYEEARRWGAQIVRIPIHPEFWREDKVQSLAVIRQVVDWSGEVGMYVILDFHAIGMLHTNRFEAAATTTEMDEFLEVLGQGVHRTR